MYHTTPSVFQRLDDEGITVAETLRFYPYRATFDFECFFDGEALPANSDRVQWIARHVPLSVSVASNVPGHEPPRCYLTDGDSDKLVGAMMRSLSAISDTAFDMLIPSYDNVLNELEVRKDTWDEAERKAPKEDDSKPEADEEVEMEESKTNPYKTLIGQLLGWHNDFDKDTFLAVLKNRRSGGGFNQGFRVRDSSVMTYIQERAALTYFYGKRKVLADGLSTAPLEV